MYCILSMLFPEQHPMDRELILYDIFHLSSITTHNCQNLCRKVYPSVEFMTFAPFPLPRLNSNSQR